MMAWALIAMYVLVVGYMSAYSIEDYSQYSMSAIQGMHAPNVTEVLVQPLIASWGFLMLFFLPLLTMRIFSEERRSGTLDLLLTYPITEAQIIGGKLLATMVVVLTMIVMSSGGLIILGRLTPLDWTVVASGYIGLVLMALSFVSLGMWASSLTKSQLVSAATTYGCLLILWVFSAVDQTGIFRESCGALSALTHLSNMTRGLVDSQDIVYFVAMSALFLFLTARVLESRKWRG